MGSIVVLGSLITDVVARAPRMPLPGESLIGDSFGTFVGGKGQNQAIAAARLGADVTLIGRVGSDAFGDSFFPALAQEGIDSTYVERDPHIDTPVSVIIVDASSGQNTIVATPGANMAIPAHAVVSALQAIRERHKWPQGQTPTGETATSKTPTNKTPTNKTPTSKTPTNKTPTRGVSTSGVGGDVETPLVGVLSPGDSSMGDSPMGTSPIFLCQCETSYESFAAGLEYAHATGMRTILNVAPIPREPLDDHLFSLVDILVVNEIEASHLSECQVISIDTAKQAAESLVQRGTRQVIITLGGQGCLWSTLERGTLQYTTLPAFRVATVDTTAAGDAFCGALAASLSTGMAMPQALRRATAAGAVAVTRMGAVASLPTAHEVDTLLSSQDDQKESENV